MRLSVQWAYFTQRDEKLSKWRIISVCFFLCIEGVSWGFCAVKLPCRCLSLLLHQPGIAEQIQDTRRGPFFLPDDLWMPFASPRRSWGKLTGKRVSDDFWVTLVQICKFCTVWWSWYIILMSPCHQGKVFSNKPKIRGQSSLRYHSVLVWFCLRVLTLHSRYKL